MVMVLLSLRMLVPILAVALAGAVGGSVRSSCADCKAVRESLVALREDLKTWHGRDRWYQVAKVFRRLPDDVASYLERQLAQYHCPEDAAKLIKEYLHRGTAAIKHENLDTVLHSKIHLGSAPECNVSKFIEDVRQHYATLQTLTTTTRALSASPSSKDAAAAEPLGNERDNDFTDTTSGAPSACSSPPCQHGRIGMMVDSPPNHVEAEPVDPARISEIRQLGGTLPVPVPGIMSAPADPGSLPEAPVGSDSNTVTDDPEECHRGVSSDTEFPDKSTRVEPHLAVENIDRNALPAPTFPGHLPCHNLFNGSGAPNTKSSSTEDRRYADGTDPPVLLPPSCANPGSLHNGSNGSIVAPNEISANPTVDDALPTASRPPSSDNRQSALNVVSESRTPTEPVSVKLHPTLVDINPPAVVPLSASSSRTPTAVDSIARDAVQTQSSTDPQGTLHNVSNGSYVAADSMSATFTTIDALQAAVMPPSSDDREPALNASNKTVAPTKPTTFKRHLTVTNVDPPAVVPPSASSYASNAVDNIARDALQKQPCTDPLFGHNQGSLHDVSNGSGVAPVSISATRTSIDALQAAVIPPSSHDRESALNDSNKTVTPTEPTPFKRHPTSTNVTPAAVVPPSASSTTSIVTDPSRPSLALGAPGDLDKSSGLTRAQIAAGTILLSTTTFLARFRDRRHHEPHPGRGVATPPKSPSISSRRAVSGAAAVLSAMALIKRAMSHRRAVPQSLSDASDSTPRPSPGTWIRTVTYAAILSLLAIGTFLVVVGYRYQRRRRPLVTIHASPDELVYKPFSLTSGIPV